MDDLVREIHETLEAYKLKADYAEKRNGVVCHVLNATEEDGSLLRTTFPRPFFYQPPIDIEKQQGFTGIAGHYKMPQGLNHVELQAYGEVLRHAELVGEISTEKMNDKFDQLLGALEARNPQLAMLDRDAGRDKLSRYNIILGIASEFNPKDIQFFLDAYPKMSAYDNPADSNKFSAVSHLNLGWLPHPDTLDTLVKQYSTKLAVDAAATVKQSLPVKASEPRNGN